MMVILWLVLNVLDAIFTILIVTNGGFEVMPVAAWLLGLGPWPFFIAKLAGTLVALLVMRRYFPMTLPVANGALVAIVGINAVSLWLT